MSPGWRLKLAAAIFVVGDISDCSQALSFLVSAAPISQLLGGMTYGNRPADETLAAAFFPRRH